MAKELAHFKNFAKLKDTSVAFNDITVIAGKPGTGKSYVMKMMYAIDEAYSLLHHKTYLMHYALMDKKESPYADIDMLTSFLNIRPKEYNDIISLVQSGNFIEAKRIIDEKQLSLNKELNGEETIEKLVNEAINEFALKQQRSLSFSNKEVFIFLLRNILQSIFDDIDQIGESFRFQNKNIILEYLSKKLSVEKLIEIRNTYSSIFVETPLILEFEKFLPKGRFKTPYHIDSLLHFLKKSDYTFTSDDTDAFSVKFQLDTDKIIDGNITKDNSGFQFSSHNGKVYNAVNTSSGTKSIGLLQYLVTNKALKKGSVLYWEEPEVHLHPSWQLKMVDLFVELMHAGVKIVFSTHSPFMADYLNALSQRKDFADRISYNVFEEKDGVVENHILDKESWSILQDELMDSFEDILWTYL